MQQYNYNTILSLFIKERKKQYSYKQQQQKRKLQTIQNKTKLSSSHPVH